MCRCGIIRIHSQIMGLYVCPVAENDSPVLVVKLFEPEAKPLFKTKGKYKLSTDQALGDASTNYNLDFQGNCYTIGYHDARANTCDVVPLAKQV